MIIKAIIALSTKNPQKVLNLMSECQNIDLTKSETDLMSDVYSTIDECLEYNEADRDETIIEYMTRAAFVLAKARQGK
jgi:cytochrome c-type biogenesis protein CcmH/NrfF